MAHTDRDRSKAPSSIVVGMNTHNEDRLGREMQPVGLGTLTLDDINCRNRPRLLQDVRTRTSLNHSALLSARNLGDGAAVRAQFHLGRFRVDACSSSVNKDHALIVGGTILDVGYRPRDEIALTERQGLQGRPK